MFLFVPNRKVYLNLSNSSFTKTIEFKNEIRILESSIFLKSENMKIIVLFLFFCIILKKFVIRNEKNA